MKTLGRVLMILIAFTIMMGITYTAVSASGSSTNASVFQNGNEGFAPSNGDTHEFREAGGGNGIGVIFGLLKNIIIVAVIVALVAFPKNLLQQKRRTGPIRIE